MLAGTIHLSSQELSDVVNALRFKAQGDREAGQALANDETAAPGNRELGRTLVAQADREEALADRIEE